MADKKILAVIGSTGAQGGGLARAILADKGGPFALRAITRKPGSCDNQLMMLSVSPSLRYSISGSTLVFTSGKTASDGMASRRGRGRGAGGAPVKGSRAAAASAGVW